MLSSGLCGQNRRPRARGLIEAADFDGIYAGHRRDEQLGDAVAVANLYRLRRQIDQNHPTSPR